MTKAKESTYWRTNDDESTLIRVWFGRNDVHIKVASQIHQEATTTEGDVGDHLVRDDIVVANEAVTDLKSFQDFHFEIVAHSVQNENGLSQVELVLGLDAEAV